MATAANRDHYTTLAKQQLEQAQRTRQNYDDLLQAAITEYGDRHQPTRPGRHCLVCRERGYTPADMLNHQTGSFISGIYADHFPTTIKDDLRTLAHNIGVQVQQAYAFWRKAGRRQHTLRPFAEAAYKLRDGRISYY